MIADRSDGSLNIEFKFVPRHLTVIMKGTAENSHAAFREQTLNEATSFCESSGVTSIALDLTELKFCCSACVRVFTNWMTAGHRPALIDLYLCNATWQVTSMIMLARMSPNCNVFVNGTFSSSTVREAQPPTEVMEASSQPPAHGPVSTGSVCPHTDTRSDEDYFYAPTGSGSTHYQIYCKACGILLRDYWEYNE